MEPRHNRDDDVTITPQTSVLGRTCILSSLCRSGRTMDGWFWCTATFKIGLKQHA